MGKIVVPYTDPSLGLSCSLSLPLLYRGVAIIQAMEGEPKVSWSRGEAHHVGKARQPFNPRKAPLRKKRLRLLRSLGCVLPSAGLSACTEWELKLTASSSPGAPRMCPRWHCCSMSKFVTPGPGARVPVGAELHCEHNGCWK